MSQSVVSLLVALIALGGVLLNNRAAEKRRHADQVAADQRRKDDQAAEDARRKADQVAADQRRKDDQAAEDARRKADDDRRERERLEQLQREDWARQRKAVADCIREITKSAELVTERAVSVHVQGNGDVERAKLVKAVELTRFNVEATSQLTLLDIEVTQPHVSALIGMLWKQIVSDYRPLLEARNRGGQAWVNQAEDMPPLSDLALDCIRALTVVARLALLECPEFMATQPVKEIDLEEFYKDSRAEKDDHDN